MKYLEIAELDRVAEALNVKTGEWKLEARIECYSLRSSNNEKKLFKDLEDKYLAVVRQVAREVSGAGTANGRQTGRDDKTERERLEEQLGSPFGSLDDPEALKTLFILITTLNATFTDHDFANVSPDDFKMEEDPQTVIENVNTTLSNLGLSMFANAVRSPALKAQASPSFGPSSLPESGRTKRDRSGSNKDQKGRSRLHASQPSTSPSTSYGSPGGFRDLPTSRHERRNMLWEVIDSVIKLDECEVYSYNPDTEADPHASYPWDDLSTEADDDLYGAVPSQTSRRDTYQTRSRTRRKRGWLAFGGTLDPPVRSRILSGYPSQNVSRETSMAPTDASTDPGEFSAEDIFSLGEVDASSVGDDDGDGGLIWSETYFFLNRRAKKLIFFTIWSVSPRLRDTSSRRARSGNFHKPRQRSFKSNQVCPSLFQTKSDQWLTAFAKTFTYDPFSQTPVIALDDDDVEEDMDI